VYEATDVMGVTVDAIRKRVSRGTIPHEKDEGKLAPPHGHLLPPVHEPRRRDVLEI
jgi:hypothetical protein